MSERNVEHLIKIIEGRHDYNYEMRMAAIKSLGATGSQRAVDYLMNIADDSSRHDYNYEMRKAALEAAGAAEGLRKLKEGEG